MKHLFLSAILQKYVLFSPADASIFKKHFQEASYCEKKSHTCSVSSSWSGSWRCVRRRAESCRNTPTRFSSRLQTTVPISWSRSSMPWRSLAENSDLRHNPAESRSPYLHPPKIKGRSVLEKEGALSHPAGLFSSSFVSLIYPATNYQDL